MCIYILPVDAKCCKEFNNDSPTKIRPINEIPNNEMGLDIGTESIKLFSDSYRKISFDFMEWSNGSF